MKGKDYLKEKGFEDIKLFSDKGEFEITPKLSDVLDDFKKLQEEIMDLKSRIK